MSEQLLDQLSLRFRPVAMSPELGRESNADGPVPCDCPGADLAPLDNAYAIGGMQHNQRPAVIAEQSRLGPASALRFRIAPAMPLMQACGNRVISHAGEPGQIIFDHRAEGYLNIHAGETTTGNVHSPAYRDCPEWSSK